MHDSPNRTRFRNSTELLIELILNLLADLLDSYLLNSNSLNGFANCIDDDGVTI